MRNFRIKITSFLAIALIGALFLAACGGSTSESTEVLTTDQVVEEDHDEDEASDSESDDDHVEDADEHEDEEADEHDDEEGDDHNDEEGDDHAHVEAPPEYADLVNPFAGDLEALEAGAVLFDVTCASCHGPTGLGDGEAAAGLDPKPATLADTDMMTDVSDGYLYWRISEGGAMEPFNSLMPAWGSGFTENQIWQLVTFVRSFSE